MRWLFLIWSIIALYGAVFEASQVINGILLLIMACLFLTLAVFYR